MEWKELGRSGGDGRETVLEKTVESVGHLGNSVET